MTTDRQLLELLVDKVTGIEQEISDIKASQKRVESRLEAVVEQTAGLLEFRTQVQIDIKELQDNGRTLAGIVGEHEVYIRSQQRKIV